MFLENNIFTQGYANPSENNNIFKKPSIPLKSCLGSNICRSPNVKSQKSEELIIDFDDIHQEVLREITDEKMIETFEKIELWKTFGNPWINELAELQTFPLFPREEDVENGSNSDEKVWKSPDLSPIHFQEE